jgi:hypothetical protein
MAVSVASAKPTRLFRFFALANHFPLVPMSEGTFTALHATNKITPTLTIQPMSVTFEAILMSEKSPSLWKVQKDLRATQTDCASFTNWNEVAP